MTLSGMLVYLPVPVAASSMVCGRLPAEIVCSNTSGDMDICL